MTIEDLTLDTTQSIDVKADIGDTFRSVLHQLGEGSTNPQGESMQVKLEQRPGGTHVDLRHRAIGFIDPVHRQNITAGWKQILDRVAQSCAALTDGQRT